MRTHGRRTRRDRSRSCFLNAPSDYREGRRRTGRRRLELVPGPAAKTIGIEVWELLFFGGALADAAFHAATICQ
jgi:hypothetical protein